MGSMAVIDIEENTSNSRLKGPWTLTFYNYLILIVLLVCCMLVIYQFQIYIRSVLIWIEIQEVWITTSIFVALFTIVSFPLTLGYTFLVIASGYLFGISRGLVTVIVAAYIGVLIAHFVMRLLQSKFPLSRFINSDGINALLLVISGPSAFKVAIFARLTPVPFGLQNTIFAVSSINTKEYLIASILGLLPAQIINVYLGTTLRSMEDVLSNKSTTATTFIVMFQMAAGVLLMLYVIGKARDELNKMLNQEGCDTYRIAKPFLEV